MNLSTVSSPPFLLRTGLPVVLVLLLLVSLAGCVEESDTILTFDVELESTTFHNHLYAPIVIYRDNEVLDTVPARATYTYHIGHRGPVHHAWRLISPYDRYGAKVGVEPYVDLGVQYRLRQTYEVTNDLPGGTQPKSGTLFTPYVVNTTAIYDLRLIANEHEDDQVITNYIFPRSTILTVDSAPYFYWHGSSNVELQSTTNSYYWRFSREDTTASGDPEIYLDESRDEYEGTGRTNALIAN